MDSTMLACGCTNMRHLAAYADTSLFPLFALSGGHERGAVEKARAQGDGADLRAADGAGAWPRQEFRGVYYLISRNRFDETTI